jgi:uncharacterized protein YjbI with pentapeptide repeats
MSIKFLKQLKRPPWLTRSKVLWSTGVALGLGIAIALVAALATDTLKFGIGAGTTTVTSEKTDSQGKVIERTITTSTQDAKTLWDLLNLMGVLAVPVTLAILAALLQHNQQQRDLEQRKIEQDRDLEQRSIENRRNLEQANRELATAENSRQEEALQYYMDRVSSLLIEKNLLQLATKVVKEENTVEEKEVLKVSVQILRAITLAALARVSEKNRTTIISFLLDADIIRQLKLNLTNANLSGISLKMFDLSSIVLQNAQISNARLLGVNLRGADLSDANLSHTELIDADLSGAILRGTNLKGANLSDANLSHTELRDADLSGAILRGTNLKGANLSGANLSHTKLTNADLSGADLSDADLGRAIPFRANLKDANLSNVDFICACLNDANLEGANLKGANFGYASLANANLRGVKGLTKEQLKQAYLFNTKLPEGVDLDPDRDLKSTRLSRSKLDEIYWMIRNIIPDEEHEYMLMNESCHVQDEDELDEIDKECRKTVNKKYKS